MATDAGNTANPRIGSRMQQACTPPSGGTRRSGEKPHGRNTVRSRHFGPEVWETMREWTLGRHVDGGAIPVVCAQAHATANPTRGGRYYRPGRPRGSEGEPSSRGTGGLPPRRFAKYLEDQPGNGQGQGGSRKGQTTCYATVEGSPNSFERKGSPLRTLKNRPTPRELSVQTEKLCRFAIL
jgi:hypothetical protein